MKIYASLLPYVFLAVWPSCTSGPEGTTANDAMQNNKSQEATLRWTGLLAADGCGFFVEIDGQEYKPANEEIIPDSFTQQDSSQVMLSYRLLEQPKEYRCGLMSTPYSMNLEILEIRAL